MPTGVFINASTILLGGLLGSLLGKRLPQRLGQALTGVFGLCAVTIGLYLIVQLSTLSAVVLSLILGTLAGEVLCLEARLSTGLSCLASRLPGDGLDQERMDNVISMIILFCFSGTGLFGAMNAGISGDHSILIAKAVMDFFTALIFGATSGYLVGVIAIPQMCIGAALYFLGSVLMPLLSLTMVSDFKSVGGVITLAVGLKISKIRPYAVLNMVPALVVVFFASYLWTFLPF